MAFLDSLIPKNERYVALLLCGMVLSTCFNGYDAGIMTVILADKQFNDYYGITDTRRGLVASIPWASTGLAQLFVGGTLANLFGRLWALRVAVTLTCLGVVVQIVPNSFGVLIFGRLLTGLGFGCTYIATSLYVSEIATSKLRGGFVGFTTQFGYQFGTLIAFWSGYGLSFVSQPYNIAWRMSNMIQIPIGLLFIGLSFWYPESPRWLLQKYPTDPARALSKLSKIRSLPADSDEVQNELHEMVAYQQASAKYDTGYWALIKHKAMRKRLLYGFYAMALQQVGGIAVVTIYATLIYQSLGWNQGSQALSINGIQSVLQLLIVFVNTFTVDRFGRKPILICGFAIQAAALLILASLTTAFPHNGNKAAAVAEVAMLFIVGLTYCWSNGPTTPAIASEIFPQYVRDKAFGLACLGQTACLLALTLPWPTFSSEVGGKSYWLLFALNVGALLSVVVILPETKGISLERMDKLFGEVDLVLVGENEMASSGATEVFGGDSPANEKTSATYLEYVKSD